MNIGMPDTAIIRAGVNVRTCRVFAELPNNISTTKYDTTIVYL